MFSDVSEFLTVPAVGHERHLWTIPHNRPVSRSTRSKGNGYYDSTTPRHIAHLEVTMSSALGADVEDAARALAVFDGYAMAHLRATNGILGPMSAVLLRTEAQSSSQIEELSVGVRQLSLEAIGAGHSSNAKLVMGNVHAMEAALRLSHELSEHTILEMHRALMLQQQGWESEAGHYRDGLVWVGTNPYSPRGASHVAPRPEYIPDLMADLVSFINRDDLPIPLQCAIAHAQFETIHPFSDGNGRCGRAIIHAILRNKGLTSHTTAPVSAGLLTMQSQYFNALNHYRTGNAGPIVAQLSQACRFAVASGHQLVDNLSQQIDRSSVLLSGVRSDSAAWRVLPMLISQPIVDAPYLIRELGIAWATAERVLATLTARTILVERTGGRRNRVWQHEGIIDVLNGYATSLRRGQ